MLTFGQGFWMFKRQEQEIRPSSFHNLNNIIKQIDFMKELLMIFLMKILKVILTSVLILEFSGLSPQFQLFRILQVRTFWTISG